MAQHNRNTIIAEYSQNTPSYITDNLYNIRKFNKSIFFRFLKISLAVSAFMSFFFLIGGYFNHFIVILTASFFGTFAVLSLIFFIEQLYFKILSKLRKKKTKT